MAIVHFYFADSQFTSTQRGALYGLTEFICKKKKSYTIRLIRYTNFYFLLESTFGTLQNLTYQRNQGGQLGFSFKKKST